MRTFCAALVAALSFNATALAATVDVDNLLVGDMSKGASGFGANSIVSSGYTGDGTVSQTWTVGQAGKLLRVDLYGDAYGTHSLDEVDYDVVDFLVTLSILSGGTASSPGETVIASISRSSSDLVRNGVSSFHFGAFDLLANAGDVLTWRMSVEACPQIAYCSHGWTNVNSFVAGGNTYGYDGGMVFTKNKSGQHTFVDWDTNFRTTMAVPEPGAWALLILGFGVAGGTLRRRRAFA